MINLLSFTVKRLLATVVVVYIIVTVVFFMAHASPYNPIKILLGQHANQQNVAALSRKYGLNQPVGTQYVNYIGGLLHGNLGYAEEQSYLGDPVSSIISTYLPVTMKLGGYALLLSLIVGLPVGLVSALYQNSVVDHGGQSIMILLYVIPTFVLAPISQLIFGAVLHWLPVSGWGDSGWSLFGLIPNPGQSLQEMILPVTIYAAGLAGFFAKSFRSFMLEVLRQDYIRTARAKGLKSRVVIYGHAVRNTLLPLASIVGPVVAYLILGAFIIELFFSIPGIAYLAATSIINSDYSVIEGITLVLVLFVIFVNMLTDVFYALVDPRVRL
ncbi:MAG TPA: ABC transporter permease [Chloroflexota bacterium]|nr:ABC transporter permease [Chloroflexota bacterium]